MLSKSSQESHKKRKFPEQAIINALLVGSKEVGKTTIGERLAGTLSNNILLAETYGIDFHFLTFKDKSYYISVQIWDVDFPNHKSDSPKYFINNTDILLLVIDGKYSFNRLKEYVDLIKSTDAPLKYLLYNKIDINGADLSPKNIHYFVREYDLHYFQISALKGIHFEDFNQDFRKRVKTLEK